MNLKFQRSRITNCNFSADLDDNFESSFFDFTQSVHGNMAVVDLNGVAIISLREYATLLGSDHPDYGKYMAMSEKARTEPTVRPMPPVTHHVEPASQFYRYVKYTTKVGPDEDSDNEPDWSTAPDHAGAWIYPTQDNSVKPGWFFDNGENWQRVGGFDLWPKHSGPMVVIPRPSDEDSNNEKP